MRCFFMLLVLAGCPWSFAGEIWIDREHGSDDYSGASDRPLASVTAGLAKLKPGMTLHFVPGTKPWPSGIRIMSDGLPDAPIVIDGHGSTVSGRAVVDRAEWNDEGNGVVSRPLPNNAWGMQNHWEGGFPLVWFDGNPGVNVRKRENLKPGSYYLYKNRKQAKTDPLHNVLFVFPPSGDAVIETIVGEGGIFVAGDHVIVKNFVCEYGGRDGFATHRNRGVVFENIEARFFMDQGMSHHGAEVTVRKAHFHHNAGAGIVDVYPEVKVRYEDCVVESDTWRGGVEFHSGEFEMTGCIIRNNPKNSVTVTRGAKAILRNCRIIGGIRGVNLSEGSELTLTGCEISEADQALSATIGEGSRLTVEGCTFTRNNTNVRLTVKEAAGKTVSPADTVRFEGCTFDDAPFVLREMEQTKPGGSWAVSERTLDQGAFISALKPASN